MVGIQGASPECLIKLYKAYIRPVLEYGAIILAAANKTRLAELERTQNSTLTTCLRLPYYTPIHVLHEQAQIEPLVQRLQTLGQNTIRRIENSQLFSELKVHKEIYKVHNKCSTLDNYAI